MTIEENVTFTTEVHPNDRGITISANFTSSFSNLFNRFYAGRLAEFLVHEFVKRYIDLKFAEMADKVDLEKVTKEAQIELATRMVRNMINGDKK